jgi:hypothetical protein
MVQIGSQLLHNLYVFKYTALEGYGKYPVIIKVLQAHLIGVYVEKVNVV